MSEGERRRGVGGGGVRSGVGVDGGAPRRRTREMPRRRRVVSRRVDPLCWATRPAPGDTTPWSPRWRPRYAALDETRSSSRARPTPDSPPTSARKGGGTDFLDISIHHPLTGPAVPYTVKVPESVLRTAVSHKSGRYRQFIADKGSRAALLPIAITTLGGWDADTREYLREVGRYERSILVWINYRAGSL